MKIEKVKKILEKVHDMGWKRDSYYKGQLSTTLLEMAKAICSPFEPEPDEGRLLSPEEQKNIINLHNEIGMRHFYSAGQRLVEAQDIKTVSIVRAGVRNIILTLKRGPKDNSSQKWQEIVDFMNGLKE